MGCELVPSVMRVSPKNLEIYGIRVTSRLFRYSPSETFLRKGVLKICRKFIGEHPCRIVISIKWLGIFIQIALWHVCSPVNLPHIFRICFPKNTSGGLLLIIYLSINIIVEKNSSYYLSVTKKKIHMLCVAWFGT